MLHIASQRLAAAGVASPQVDVELLAAHVLGLSRGEVQIKLALGDLNFTDSQAEEYERLIARREAREPLQHLTGTAYFRNLELKVGPGVFVPRPETEFVVSLALEHIKPGDTVVDFCTGSGAIALSVATEVEGTSVFAIEKSEEAIGYTRKNFATYAPEASLVLGDLDGSFEELNANVDNLISNPPYIPAKMVPIYPEVALHDPSLALYGGEDGLEVIRSVSTNALRLLKSGGMLTIEHADSQGESVRQLLLNDGWLDVHTHQDFNGRDRAVTAFRS